MRPFLIAALYIAFVLAVAAVALSAQSDASRAFPEPINPHVAALGRQEGGTVTIGPQPNVTNSAAPGTTPPSTVRPLPSRSVLPAPTSMPRHARFLRGQATWWDSWGSGFYVAVNPSDGIPVGSVIEVCDAQAQHCLSAPVTTTCACKGPDSGRIVDLSLDLFSRFADPARGVTTVVLEVVP